MTYLIRNLYIQRQPSYVNNNDNNIRCASMHLEYIFLPKQCGYLAVAHQSESLN